jgi:ribokinase
VVVVGSLNVDHVVAVDHLPARGETVAGSGYVSVPGGKGLNQAVTAARLGAATAMVGCVGEDEGGTRLLDVLRGERIDASEVISHPTAPSGVALITVAGGGSNTVVVAAGSNAGVTAAQVEGSRVIGQAAVVLTQLEIPREAVRAALSAGRAAGAVTVLNPAPATEALPDDLLALADVVVPNETEARALTGLDDPEAAARALLAAGARAVIVTLGEEGVLVATGAADGSDGPVVERVSPFKVDAVDSTAAGDAFCGALAAALAAGKELSDAVRHGAAAGALAATVMGAVPSLPRRGAVDHLLAAQS